MFVISKAKPDDFSAISTLDVSIAEFCHDAIQLVDSAMAWLTWIEGGGLVFKASNENNDIIGAVVAFPVKKRGWCVHKILVSNDYLQESVALSLLEELLHKIDNREEKAYVIVHPQDLYAIKMYSMLGFGKQVLHKDYLGISEDRFVLSRPKKWTDVEKSKKKRKQQKADNMWNIPSILTDPKYMGNKLN